jgi:acetyltransferase-like isoleucine patch superfamily enzyme
MTLAIRVAGGSVGTGLEAESGTTLRWGGHKGITIGSGVRFGTGVIIDVPEGGRLTIGDRVKVMHHTVIAAEEDLTIGADTQIAEHCSLRDSDHGTDPDRLIREQNVTTPTVIGSDVWIGRGSAVLRGSIIGDGAVIGANSITRGNIEPGSISVGAPARHKRYRRAD